MIAGSTLSAAPDKPRLWFDLLVVAGLVAVIFGAMQVASEWRHPLQAKVVIDLSARALPRYMLFSLTRGWIAYFFSLIFTLVVASWAFYDLTARRYILPALDVLQSIPVLGFLPGLNLALLALFPHSNVGVELVCILAIFTGQVWNMAFSYYDSLRGAPADFRMLSRLYNFSWWYRFWRVELPFSAQGLLYNSMVGMAGGWFFLTVAEAPPPSGDQVLMVPGLGSYMKTAYDQRDVRAQIFGAIAMGVIILAVDRLVWWPLVVWSRKFKLDDFGGNRAAKGRLQLWLARSRPIQSFALVGQSLKQRLLKPPVPPTEATSLAEPNAPPPPRPRTARTVYTILVASLVLAMLWGGFRLVMLLSAVHLADWLEIGGDCVISFFRVLAAVGLGTLWTVPAGIWIGLNPKLSSRLQPFLQFVASYPAPIIYPWLMAVVFLVHGTLQWGSILLILFGTQWYILFNVAAGAAAIPNDIVCCADILRLSGWGRWSKFLIPAVLPSLVTGWVTAAGGAWNATIISEYVTIHDQLYQATGLGAYIGRASDANNFPRLAAAVIVMAAVVVCINRTVWKRLQTLANERCRFIT